MPIPKEPNPIFLNDYRPIALTSLLIKSFEKIVLKYIPKNKNNMVYLCENVFFVCVRAYLGITARDSVLSYECMCMFILVCACAYLCACESVLCKLRTSDHFTNSQEAMCRPARRTRSQCKQTRAILFIPLQFQTQG